MIVYVDTSAAAKRIVREAESDALARYLDELAEQDRLVSSRILETELRRIATRRELPQYKATAILDLVDLFEPSPGIFHEAGILPGRDLRSLDALHLATALRVGADLVVAYDRNLLSAATHLGLETVSPA